MNKDDNTITIKVEIEAPVEIVWKKWTTDHDIVKWNKASEDWHTPLVLNDLKPGGKFHYRMEAKDGSNGFDFDGIYDKIKRHELIEYSIVDGRKVQVQFDFPDDQTILTETFEAEKSNPLEVQQAGWQSILDNFKKYVEWGSL